jgi:hypothetical protein
MSAFFRHVLWRFGDCDSVMLLLTVRSRCACFMARRKTTMAQADLTAADPFALMMNPQAILQAIEASPRLQRLQSRVCRPLDRPLIPHKDEAGELDAFDREIESSELQAD